MGLTACPDCGGKVSKSAPACPICGRPIAGARAGGYLNPTPSGSVLTTERTGKSLKLQQALATLTLLIGITCLITAFVGYSQERAVELGKTMLIGAAMVGVSLPWMIVVRMKSWWRHG